jgi:hypothetical protein
MGASRPWRANTSAAAVNRRWRLASVVNELHSRGVREEGGWGAETGMTIPLE